MHGAALLVSNPGWAEGLIARLLPGAHVVLFTENETDAITGRLAGLHLRDTLLILRPMTSGFAFLFRKPLVEPTVVEQTAKTGTGGVNVNRCRIGTKTELHSSSPQKHRNTMNKGMVTGTETESRSYGRWPTNVLIVHGSGCTLIGEKRIEGHKGYPNGPGGSSSQFSQKGTKTTRTGAWAGHADADGMETIPEWVCEDGCLARRLDGLSGVLTSGEGNVRRKPYSGYHGGDGVTGAPEVSYGDAGGASRFYPQFRDEAEMVAWIRQLVTVPTAPTLERGL